MSKKKIILLVAVLGIMYYYKDTMYQKISHMIQQKEIKVEIEEPKYYLVNVLGEKDFNDAHIKGSINIPFEKVNSFLNAIKNKEIPLIFYCSNYFCTASDAAAKMAIKKNFKTVFVYKGGMAEWYQAAQEDKSFEYVGLADADYLKIVILPQEEILDPELDIIDEDNSGIENFKIISINNLQNFLKEGILIK